MNNKFLKHKINGNGLKSNTFKSSVTTPNTILAIDLMNMEKFMVRDFKYFLNGIDMSSSFFYSIASKN